MTEKMKAYSLDLRQKIIQIYENEEISQRQLAKRFWLKGKLVTITSKNRMDGYDYKLFCKL